MGAFKLLIHTIENKQHILVLKRIIHEKFNIANEISKVISKMNLLRWINYIQLKSEGHARFYIAIVEQCFHIPTFCLSKSDESCLLGVDRAFWLCLFIVTITIFPQLTLQTTVRNAHLAFLGPALISIDATQQTDEWFFDYIRGNLNEPLTGIALDENSLILVLIKKAIINSLERKWPKATQKLCDLHLSKNLKRTFRLTGIFKKKLTDYLKIFDII